MKSRLALAIASAFALSSSSTALAAKAREPRHFALHPRGGTIAVEVSRGAVGFRHADLETWIDHAATAVTRYFGRFPVSRVELRIETGGDGRIHYGLTRNGRRPSIDIAVGRFTTADDFRDDWVLTHEMTHLAFPSLPDAYSWVEEGLATYVEPIARARAGFIPASDVWKWLVDGLPKGEPQAGDGGLDGTESWGRIYWGGALFWFVADVRIREETHGEKSLDDALRAIARSLDELRGDATLAPALAVGDRATETKVLSELHAEMGKRAVTVDLATYWKKLGVVSKRGELTFDDEAPLAAIRKGIESGAP